MPSGITSLTGVWMERFVNNPLLFWIPQLTLVSVVSNLELPTIQSQNNAKLVKITKWSTLTLVYARHGLLMSASWTTIILRRVMLQSKIIPIELRDWSQLKELTYVQLILHFSQKPKESVWIAQIQLLTSAYLQNHVGLVTITMLTPINANKHYPGSKWMFRISMVLSLDDWCLYKPVFYPLF